jgi:hypothetical protein
MWSLVTPPQPPSFDGSWTACKVLVGTTRRSPPRFAFMARRTTTLISDGYVSRRTELSDERASQRLI